MQMADTMQRLYMVPSSKKILKDDMRLLTETLKEQTLQTYKKQLPQILSKLMNVVLPMECLSADVNCKTALKRIPFIAPTSFISCMTHTYDQHTTCNRSYIRHMKALYSSFPFRKMVERSSSHQYEEEKCNAVEAHGLRNPNRNPEMALHSLQSTAPNPLRLPMRQS